MKLAQFKTKTSEEARLGLLNNDVIVDITEIAPTTLDFIKRGAAAVHAAKNFNAQTAYALDAVEYLPAVNPGKIIAIGRNYYDHAIEGGDEPPKSPLMFTKFLNSLNAHNADVTLHAISEKIDFEAELAVIIGKRAGKVSEAEALDYVFGYSCLDDVSARDLQFSDGQWVRGKGLDGFCPIGPFAVTKDEIANPQGLKIEGILNGEVMQSSNTDKMIFSIAYLIHYITQAITLEPGDVIATGTPEGVGVFRKPPRLLQNGDVFEVVIENVGTLRNRFVSAQ
ncbi:MAG TPA: fumarylacetoacetate hydrolase family protein [Blastocatellia bacterium]|nr:fumarylacetoacetate hydrolase family protein [Blastocatellia bacterium]HMX27645.1 fumarylacetoacetate hydrolase family protein [Blastocatellia bacterium]HMZ21135.1 fumarylacetoacetate hydrolase family protein [Blastocatellia bacterium]HNG31075.1 fumarylacetoacetate hydrolase family protein [Blastocatellia bacterium]